MLAQRISCGAGLGLAFGDFFAPLVETHLKTFFFAPTVSLSPSIPDAPACQDLPACLLQLEADGILPVFSTSMYQGHCEFPYIVCFIFGFAMLELVLKVILMLKKDDQKTYLTLTLMGTIFTSGPHHLGIPLGKCIKRMIAPG